MLYIITKLVTEGQQKAFSIIGASEDKKRAAAIAADVYKDYNKNASFQNIEMITEWLATRQNYSFRKDKELISALYAILGFYPHDLKL